VFSLTGIFLLAAWLSVMVLSLWAVRDIFSPDKLMFAALGVFFGGIFFDNYSLGISAVYALLLVASMTVIVAFAPILRSTQSKLVARAPNREPGGNGMPFVGYGFFWLVSLPALAAQVGMIEHFGGIAGYVNILSLRVKEFEGLGWLTSIIRTFSIIDLIYFSYLITRRKLTVSVIVVYVIHLLIFVVLALLTGSRGSLLVNFLLMALVYHNSVRRISARWLLTLAASTLLIASMLEVARQRLAFGEEGILTGLSEERQNEKKMSFAWAKYGINPLELLLNADRVTMYYGLTYLTVFTNIIPRAIWPEKPDSGGVILTKEYTSETGGTSYLSTGIIPEAIMNFGVPLGIVVGTFEYGALVGGLILYYIRYRQRLLTNSPYKFIDSVRFAYISWGMMGLIVGEFTNVIVNLLVQLITVWAINQLIRMFPTRMRS
jgi:hypothetical protein